MDSEEFYKQTAELVKKDLSRLKMQNNELSKQIFELREKRETLLEEYVKLCNENDRFKEQIEKLQQLNVEIPKTIDMFENVEHCQNDLNINLAGLQDMLTTNLNNIESEIKEEFPFYENIEGFEVKSEDLFKNRVNLEQTNSVTNKIYEEQLKEVETEIEKIMQECKKFIQQTAENETEALQLNYICGDLQKEVESKKNTISGLDDNISNLEQIKAKLKSEIKNKKSGIKTTEATNS